MTLVLSVINPAYSLQVADRLLTANLQPVDLVSNKNILFFGRDGCLCIGYSGPAFLHGVPTDVRIAGALTSGAALKGQGMQFGPGAQTRDVGWAMRAVTAELQRHKSFARGNGEVIAVGWQWGRKRRQLRRSVCWQIARGSEERLHLQQLLPKPLFEGWNDLCLISAGDDPFDDDERRDLIGALAAAGSDRDAAEAMLVSAVRQSAGRRATIGPHCISLLIAPPNPRIRFIPQEPHLALAAGRPIEVGFCPWVIAPGAIVPPSELIGDFQVHAGSLLVDVEGPEPKEGQSLLGAFQQQLRPRVPGYPPHPHSIPRPWQA